MKLLRTLILRPLLRDRLRTAITILAVALGVAVVVAIDLAADAAAGSFRSSIKALSGKTDFEIFANGRIDERWFGRLATLPVDARFSAVLEAQILVPGIGAVPLYGIDMLGRAGEDTVLASAALAKRLPPDGLIEANVEGHIRHFRATAMKRAGPDEFLLMDIAASQELLNRYGKLDRIDVTVAHGEDRDRVERMLRATLPAAYLIEKPGARSQENETMLRAFRLNLRALSYIALLVGAFLIYNTISVSVVRRRAEIGILRAIGAGRGTVLAVFLTEALLLGMAGAAVGVALGRVLAEATVHTVGETVNALYTTSRPAPVELTLANTLTAIVTALAVAFLCALGPACEAMNVAPTEAMSRGAHEHRARLRWRRGLVWSAILAALAAVAAQAAPIGGYPVGGYVAALLAVGVVSLAAPAMVLAVNRATRSLTRRSASSLLASRGLAASLSRTSVVVAALATAIAMMVSVGIMVGSFRETVSLWLDDLLRADLHIRSAIRPAPGEFPPIDPAVGEIVRSTPGVAAADLYHGMEFHFRGQRPTLGAGDMELSRFRSGLRFLPGERRDAILRALPHHDLAIAAESFANKFGLHAGDRIAVPLGDHQVTFTIAGIFYDYAGGQGRILMDSSTLLRYLPGQPVSSIAIYLAPGADSVAVERQIQLRAAPYGISIARNADLRRLSMTIFDRTFALTWALEAVAILVAVLGAANSLLALVLDRRRSLGLLRYLGASTGQIRGLILTEAAFLGGFAALAGLALGLVLSLLLILVVDKQSFGWTIQFHPPAGLLAGALLLIWCVTVLAGLYPARVASRLNPIDVIHEE
jgi:putative ABC transport system permease protein